MAIALLGSIPLLDRIRLGLVTLYLQRRKDWKPFERVTAHEWLQKALGTRAYEKTQGFSPWIAQRRESLTAVRE